MIKHAPRGRIKAREGEMTLGGADPSDGRCTAHSSRTGLRCRKFPIHGGTVCETHGGSAPQVQAKAEERLKALQNKAITRIESLIDQTEYPSTAYAASRDVLDRTMGKPKEQVEMQLSGEVSLITARLLAARKRLADSSADSPAE